MAQKIIPANPRSRADIDSFAMSLLYGFQRNAIDNPEPVDIELFFEIHLPSIAAGVVTDYKNLPPEIHGYTDIERGKIVISRDLVEDPRQERFFRSTTAHESYHGLVHIPEFRAKKALSKLIHGKDHGNLRLYRASEIKTYCNPEWQAWRFAGTFLMPESAFRKAASRRCDEIYLADLFNINPAFIRSRVKALGL